MTSPLIFKQLSDNEKAPWHLLLLADPNVDMVTSYLKNARVYLLDKHITTIGCCVVVQHSENLMEIMNLAIDESQHNKGYGKLLLSYSIEQIKDSPFYGELLIKTGSISYPAIALYHKVGFKDKAVIKDYFIENYPEPIYEEGELLRDQLILSQQIG